MLTMQKPSNKGLGRGVAWLLFIYRSKESLTVSLLQFSCLDYSNSKGKALKCEKGKKST